MDYEINNDIKNGIIDLTEEAQDEIVDYINEQIDMPFLNEKQEERVMMFAYDMIQKVLRDVL